MRQVIPPEIAAKLCFTLSEFCIGFTDALNKLIGQKQMNAYADHMKEENQLTPMSLKLTVGGVEVKPFLSQEEFDLSPSSQMAATRMRSETIEVSETQLKQLHDIGVVAVHAAPVSFFYPVLDPQFHQTQTLDQVVAVMCDQKERTIPAIIRAIWEMSGYWACIEEVTLCLGLVRERGWGLKTAYDHTNSNIPTTYRLVKHD